MTREEAELLILRTEERLCARFYQRKDGTVLTANCPVGLQAIKNKWTGVKARIVAAVLSLTGYTAAMVGWQSSRHDLGMLSVIAEGLGHPNEVAIMGAIPLPLSQIQTIRRSERFMRERALSRLIPIFHEADGSSAFGLAVVSIEVSETGDVDNVTFINGPPAASDLVEQAARGWTFKPTILDGKPVRGRKHIELAQMRLAAVVSVQPSTTLLPCLWT
jgi:hypothetical protein